MNKKRVSLVLLNAFLLCSCGETSSTNNKEDIFTVCLNALTKNYVFDKIGENEASINELETYYFDIMIPNKSWTEGKDNTDKISFSYNEELISVDYSFTLNKLRRITYKLRALDVFDNERLDITFIDTTYEINLTSLKHEFSDKSKIDSDTMDKDFSEFKEMIDSIQYHKYETPYVGIEHFGGASQHEEYLYHSSFNEEYNLDYLHYLKDDVYYPSRFDLAFPNVAQRNMNMVVDDITVLMPNSDKTTMARFEVALNVIDPDCTAPTNPLHSLLFLAVPFNYESPCESINKRNNDLLIDKTYLLSKKYSDEFSTYVVNDIAIRLTKSGNSLYGFFEDDTYSYRIHCLYSR